MRSGAAKRWVSAIHKRERQAALARCRKAGGRAAIHLGFPILRWGPDLIAVQPHDRWARRASGTASHAAGR
jgi:hypothetical protein